MDICGSTETVSKKPCQRKVKKGELCSLHRRSSPKTSAKSGKKSPKKTKAGKSSPKKSSSKEIEVFPREFFDNAPAKDKKRGSIPVDSMDYFYVLYNPGYGGFSIPKKLRDEASHEDNYRKARTDKQLFKKIFEMGNPTNLDVVAIPNELKDCWDLSEYDGAETINLEWHPWIVKTLKNVKTLKEFKEELKKVERKLEASNSNVRWVA